MTAPTADWKRLADLLARDSIITRELIELLERERSALEARDYDKLQHLVADKQPLLAELESRGNQRRGAIERAGFGSEAELLARARQEAPDVASEWLALGEMWQRCQELNQINEQIVQRTKLVVGRLLDVLRGEPQQSAVYDQQGSTRRGGGGRPLGSA